MCLLSLDGRKVGTTYCKPNGLGAENDLFGMFNAINCVSKIYDKTQKEMWGSTLTGYVWAHFLESLFLGANYTR